MLIMMLAIFQLVKGTKRQRGAGGSMKGGPNILYKFKLHSYINKYTFYDELKIYKNEQIQMFS